MNIFIAWIFSISIHLFCYSKVVNSLSYRDFITLNSERICNSEGAPSPRYVCETLDSAYEGECKSMSVRLTDETNSYTKKYTVIALCKDSKGRFIQIDEPTPDSQTNSLQPPKCVSMGDADDNNLIITFDYDSYHNLCTDGVFRLIGVLRFSQFEKWNSNRLCNEDSNLDIGTICSRLGTSYDGECQKMLVQIKNGLYGAYESVQIAKCQAKDHPPKCVAMGMYDTQTIVFEYTSDGNRCINGNIEEIWKRDKFCDKNYFLSVTFVCGILDSTYKGKCKSMLVSMTEDTSSQDTYTQQEIGICETDDTTKQQKCVTMDEEDNLIKVFDYNSNENKCIGGKFRLIEKLRMSQFNKWKSGRLCDRNSDYDVTKICSKWDITYSGKCQNMVVQIQGGLYGATANLEIAKCESNDHPPKCVAMGPNDQQIILFNYIINGNACTDGYIVHLNKYFKKQIITKFD